MYMAIAVETPINPLKRLNYKVWFLEISEQGYVMSLGVKTKEELVKSIFKNIRTSGRSNWRAYLKGSESSCKVEVYDFISLSPLENTHFGNLPTLSEFQKTLEHLNLNLEAKPIAC